MNFSSFQVYLEKSFDDNLQVLNHRVYEALNVPKDVGQQYFKQVAARQYNFKKKKFNHFLNGSFAPLSYLRFLGFVSLVFLRSKHWQNEPRLNADLIIDDIQHYGEPDRWLKLIRLFGEKRVVLILRNKLILSQSGDFDVFMLLNGIGYSRSIFNKIPFNLPSNVD